MNIETHPVGRPPQAATPAMKRPSARLDWAVTVGLSVVMLLFHLGFVNYWLGLYQSYPAENDLYESLWIFGGFAGLGTLVLAFAVRAIVQRRRCPWRQNATRGAMAAALLFLLVGGCWLGQWTYEDGVAEWCRSNVDAEVIRAWAATVPTSGTVSVSSAPAAVRRLGSHMVSVDTARGETTFGYRSMGHYTLVIGPTDALPPKADGICYRSVQPIEPGMYLIWTD